MCHSLATAGDSFTLGTVCVLAQRMALQWVHFVSSLIGDCRVWLYTVYRMWHGHVLYWISWHGFTLGMVCGIVWFYTGCRKWQGMVLRWASFLPSFLLSFLPLQFCGQLFGGARRLWPLLSERASLYIFACLLSERASLRIFACLLSERASLYIFACLLSERASLYIFACLLSDRASLCIFVCLLSERASSCIFACLLSERASLCIFACLLSERASLCIFACLLSELVGFLFVSFFFCF